MTLFDTGNSPLLLAVPLHQRKLASVITLSGNILVAEQAIQQLNIPCPKLNVCGTKAISQMSDFARAGNRDDVLSQRMNYKWEFCEREQSFDVALTGDLALNSDTIMIEAASAGLAFVLKGLVQWLREWVL